MTLDTPGLTAYREGNNLQRLDQATVSSVSGSPATANQITNGSRGCLIHLLGPFLF